jgi:uncharacterized membrane protein YebE (DUF533 family)
VRAPRLIANKVSMQKGWRPQGTVTITLAKPQTILLKTICSRRDGVFQQSPKGYVSGIYGKWGLGTLKRFLPTSRGFDDFYGLVNTGIDYYTHERYGVHSMYRNEVRSEEDKATYCTYLFEREALRLLENHAAAGSDDASNPFFLYVPFNAPHGSSSLDLKIRGTVQAPPEFQAMYPPVEAEFKEGTKYGKEAMVPTREKRYRDYRAAVTCMDVSIGKMLDVLDEKGIADNTIVILFSDNGGSGGARTDPLRGHKSQMWEGGVRVLSMVRWPKGGSGGGLGALAGMFGGGGDKGGMGGLLGSILGGGDKSGGGAGGLGALAGMLGGGAAAGGLPGKLMGGGDDKEEEPEQVAAAVPQEANQEAELLIRAMCHAAKADGRLDDTEKENIIARLGEEVTQTEIDFVQGELSASLDVDRFIGEVPSGAAQQVYSFSVMAIKIDEQTEANYLGQLAQGLRLDTETCNRIHDQLGAPRIFS